MSSLPRASHYPINRRAPIKYQLQENVSEKNAVNRIFDVLALAATGFLVLAFTTGLMVLTGGDIRDPADVAAQQAMFVHRLSGMTASLVVLLVDSVAVTYFIGTSRWCREVCETYRLAGSLTAESSRLKKRAFPASLTNMATIIGIAALGAVADPMTGSVPPSVGGTWGNYHFAAGCVGLCIMAGAVYLQRGVIRENQALIARVLAEVQRIRTARGLDV